MSEAYNECKKAGYDVKFELHCFECYIECYMKKRKLPSAVFRFRDSEEEYTVSYPLIKGEDFFGGDEDQLTEKHFYPWQYTLAVGFLKEVVACENSTNVDEACRQWLDDIAESIEYEGNPWSIVDKSIKGILGLSLKRSR